jgi:hypothetical protein
MEELRTSAVKRRFYTHIQGVGNIEDSASNDARVASGSDGPGLVATVPCRLKAFFIIIIINNKFLLLLLIVLADRAFFIIIKFIIIMVGVVRQ